MKDGLEPIIKAIVHQLIVTLLYVVRGQKCMYFVLELNISVGVMEQETDMALIFFSVYLEHELKDCEEQLTPTDKNNV